MTSVDAQGRNRIRRDYYVNGVVKVSAFLGVGGDSRQETTSNRFDDVAQGGPSDQPSFSAPRLPRLDCPWTSPDDGQTYYDCATQEDIDDALAEVAAMDSDISGLQAEADADAAAYCQTAFDPDLCGGGLTSSTRSLDGGHGPFVAETPCPEHPRDSTGGLATPFSCAGQAIFAGVSVGAWVGSKYQLIELVTVINPAAGAVGWGLFAALTAGAAAAWGIAEYIDCISK